MEAGLDPSAFWSLTPKEMITIYEAAVARLQRRQRREEWIVWHIDALRRSDRLPAFEEFTSAPRRAQTPEEQEMIVRTMHAVIVARSESPRTNGH